MTNKTELIKEIFDLSRSISSNLPESKLTMIQLRTMIYIAKQGLAKPTEIAKNFAITPASVTSQIDNLVEDGWLERVYNQDDKRVIEVALTARGQSELPKEISKLEENCDWLFTTLDTKEQKELLSLLKKANKASKE